MMSYHGHGHGHGLSAVNNASAFHLSTFILLLTSIPFRLTLQRIC